MKKLLFLLLAAVPAMFASCSGDDHDTAHTPSFLVHTDADEVLSYATTRHYALSLDGVDEVKPTGKPAGWSVSVSDGKLVVTAPSRGDASAEMSGTVSVAAYSGGSHYRTHTFNVTCGLLCDFEDPRVDDYLAISAAGDNLYSAYEGIERYYGYDDAATDLIMMLVYGFDWNTYDDDYNFYNGGVAVSRWNDMSTSGAANQCSVYYRDPATGFGGRKGSPTFAVAFDGSGLGAMMGPSYDYNTYINFADDDQDEVFDHIWVNNSTWTVLAMRDGSHPARVLDYEHNDWLKVTVSGITSGGVSTGTVDVYLADFRTAGSPGIVTEWQRVDLSSLGAVNKLKFNMSGSDSGSSGLNTPAYFCIDDILIR